MPVDRQVWRTVGPRKRKQAYTGGEGRPVRANPKGAVRVNSIIPKGILKSSNSAFRTKASPADTLDQEDLMTEDVSIEIHYAPGERPLCGAEGWTAS